MHTVRFALATILTGALAACGGSSSSSGTGSTTVNAAGVTTRPMVHQEGRVVMDVPTTWQVEASQNSMELKSPDNEIAMLFFMTRGMGEADAVLSSAAGELERIVSQPRVGQVSNVNVNGMNGRIVPGSGFVRGVQISFLLALIQTPSNEWMVVIVLADSHAPDHDFQEARAVIDSIRPM